MAKKKKKNNNEMKVLLWSSESPCLDHNVLFWHDLKPAVNAQKPYCG